MYQILKGGCDARHAGTFSMQRPHGLPHYILLIIRTHGEFRIDKLHYSVTPGQAVIIAPYTPYSYSNPYGDYMDDWLHFEVSDVAGFSKSCPLINVPFPIRNTENYTTLIRQILWEASYMEPLYAAPNIDALFTVLLNHLIAAHQNKAADSASSMFEKTLQILRLKMQSTPAERHSISTYAKEIGVSKSYFQHLYSDLFGISFQKDLIRLRIDHAKYILTTTDLPLEQVSEICGYTNEVHFYRQFKQLVGTTPAKYRKQALK